MAPYRVNTGASRRSLPPVGNHWGGHVWNCVQSLQARVSCNSVRLLSLLVPWNFCSWAECCIDLGMYSKLKYYLRSWGCAIASVSVGAERCGVHRRTETDPDRLLYALKGTKGSAPGTVYPPQCVVSACVVCALLVCLDDDLCCCCPASCCFCQNMFAVRCVACEKSANNVSALSLAFVSSAVQATLLGQHHGCGCGYVCVRMCMPHAYPCSCVCVAGCCTGSPDGLSISACREIGWVMTHFFPHPLRA
jgi:hypothetical protein